MHHKRQSNWLSQRGYRLPAHYPVTGAGALEGLATGIDQHGFRGRFSVYDVFPGVETIARGQGRSIDPIAGPSTANPKCDFELAKPGWSLRHDVGALGDETE